MQACVDTLRAERIEVERRVRVVALLIDVARISPCGSAETEHCMHDDSQTNGDVYDAHARRVAFNVACNAALALVPAARLVQVTDAELAAGTYMEQLQRDETARSRAYADLLQEKYNNVVAARGSETLLSCRRCGSSEINWVQKQVRGADEAMTCFCTCLRCKNRWRLG